MLKAYIRGQKPQTDARGNAATALFISNSGSVLQDLTKT